MAFWKMIEDNERFVEQQRLRRAKQNTITDGGDFFKRAKSAVQSINRAFDNKDKSYSEYKKDIDIIKSDFEKCCREKDFEDVSYCLGTKVVPPTKANLCRGYNKAEKLRLSTEKTKKVH